MITPLLVQAEHRDQSAVRCPDHYFSLLKEFSRVYEIRHMRAFEFPFRLIDLKDQYRGGHIGFSMRGPPALGREGIVYIVHAGNLRKLL